MEALDIVLLLVGGAFAGVVNAMAGGGSMLTVPLLVIAGQRYRQTTQLLYSGGAIHEEC